MKHESVIYKAYALYLARFVEEYRKEGINLMPWLCRMNRRSPPTTRVVCGTPTSSWSSSGITWGPYSRREKLGVEIMLVTIQDPDYYKFPIRCSRIKKANAYISLVGFQWRGLSAVVQTRANFPEKRIMQTETECGNFYWQPGFNPHKPPNDWAYGSHTWKKVKEFFECGGQLFICCGTWSWMKRGKNLIRKGPGRRMRRWW